MNAAEQFDTICQTRLENLVPVDQPLCLISQLPRSGGTLLMRLFDGHPDCHSIPHEFGQIAGSELEALEDPEVAWARLNPEKLPGWFKRGYAIAQRKNSDQSASFRFPLLIAPDLQRQIFLERYPESESFSRRAVFNAYFTSYFNAWIDNQNLYTADAKQWVVAFEPRAILKRRYREQLKEAYPDGKIISVVREPHSWYASARGWSLEWTSVVPAMEFWKTGVEELLKAREEFPDQMAIVDFGDLVGRTPATMRSLNKWLGIASSREALRPTFNGKPSVPNTSFKTEGKGVVKEPLRRAKGLSEADRRQIDGLSGDLMERVAEFALQPAKKKPKK